MPDDKEAAELAPDLSVQSVYFNGFQLGLSNADAWLMFMLDNQPFLKANMSYTVAKTLVGKLQTMIDTLEESTGRKIMTTDDAGEGLSGAVVK